MSDLPSSVTALSPRHTGHTPSAGGSSGAAPTDVAGVSVARARWCKLRAALTVLRSLRDRKPSDRSSSKGDNSVGKAVDPSSLGLQQNAQPSKSKLLFSDPQKQRQPGHGVKQSDVRSVAIQMEAWLAKKRDLFQRVINKPIQNRSDVDIKLLADYIRQARFLSDLSSASTDELARALHFQTFCDGEVLFHQGDSILDTSGRFMVVQGSLFVYRNLEYARRAHNGEGYMQWFLATNAGVSDDAVRYGECIGTCSIGDTCGDDAWTGPIFRETTVISQAQTIVAYITQASFRRVQRYNVNFDTSLLAVVSSTFYPLKATRVGMRSTFVATCKLSEAVLGDKVRYSHLQRFFGQFSCFRALPPLFRAELMRKVESRVFRSDEVLCHASDTTSPKFFMVLSGKVCLHYSDPFEAAQLQSHEDKNYALNPPTTKRKTNLTWDKCLEECDVPKEVAAHSPHSASRHICTLVAGDTFGDVGMRERRLLQGATLFNPITAGAPCSVLALSYDDYNATLARYLKATEFTEDVAHVILSDTLPQDRSCEQVGYLWAYLTRKCQARVFFNQLPLHTLNKICLHAHLEKYVVGDDITDFIQNEDEDVSSMRVVLNGYVCTFKKSSRHSLNQHNTSSQSTSDTPTISALVPKPAVLRRLQSRLIRGNTRLLDDLHAASTAGRGGFDRVKQFPVGTANDEVHTVDPVSILPHGAAFGQHQIFTSSKSPYSYAAYSAGPPPPAEVAPVLLHQNTVGKSSSSGGAVHVLSIPARFVKICFTAIDEFIVYNPVRIFKRIANSMEASAKSSGALSNALYGLNFDRLLFLSPCFSGIPRTRLSAAVASIDLVHVPARRIIYDTGESTKGANFLVLSGHVRIFTVYASKNRQVQQKLSVSTEEKRLPKLLRKVSQNLLATHVGLEKQSSLPFLQCPFDRYAGDHIFLRDYDRTLELGIGDCFGRQVGGKDASDQSASKRFCVNMTSKASSIQQQQVSSSGESAVTMSECLIGSLSLKRLSNAVWMLDSKEKRELIGLIQMREEFESTFEGMAPLTDFNNLATSFKIIERMRLGNHLTTAQRVCVANSLRYCRIKAGDTVYKQGEDSLALYIILAGKIRLFSRVKEQHTLLQQRAPSGMTLPEDWLVNLFEGDVFGEEVIFDGCIGSLRLTTAVAASTIGTEDVELLYLTRQQYEEISAPHLQVGKLGKHRLGITNIDKYSQQLLRLGKQTMEVLHGSCSSRERWKIAINHVIQGRAKRSRWHSVLLNAKRHRVKLMFDLLHGLPVLAEAPKVQVLTLCASATLQTYTQDSIVFAKGDSVADQCFFVLTGTVVLQQFCSGTTYNSAISGVSPLTLSSPAQEISTQKVTVQTMKAGDVFGDFELLVGKQERQIHAATCNSTTKLIIMPREDFLAYWPRRARLEAKLLAIKNAFYGVHNLDFDYLCSLYYAMQEKAFNRNEVMSGSSSQGGYLYIIENGFSIVHDRVTLQKRSEKITEPSQSPSRLAVDTREASLGPGSILYTEKREGHVGESSSRRASSKSQTTSATNSTSAECEKEYVTADSPVVHTFSLQLFPRKYAYQVNRSAELFAAVVLGKHGLQAIKKHINEHRSWRTDNTVYTSRAAESSLPREGASSSKNNKMKLKLQTAPNAISSSHSMDLAQFLKGRELGRPESQSSQSGYHTRTDKVISNQLGPRAHAQISGQTSPCKVHVPLGSFGNPQQINESKAFSFPALSCSSKEPKSGSLPQLVGSPPTLSSKGSTAPTSSSLNEQLKREELVLEALSNPSKMAAGRNTLELEKQQRRRHGRPPPKIVENRGMFIDEHAFIPVINLKQEHDRKKSGLCRRLLHLK